MQSCLIEGYILDVRANMHMEHTAGVWERNHLVTRRNLNA